MIEVQEWKLLVTLIGMAVIGYLVGIMRGIEWARKKDSTR